MNLLVQVGLAGALLVTAAVSSANAGSLPKTQPKRQVRVIAVAQFAAPNAARARSAVLEALSEHDDVEVASLEDIAVTGKRLGADPSAPAGRRKLSEELGIEAWLDGSVEDGLARFTLHAPDGRVLASTSIRGHKANVAEGLAGPKVWEAMGPILSVRERSKRALEAQQELAQKKVQAREQELVRLRQQAEARAAARVAQLKAAQALAREKHTAFVAELDRQRTIVSERVATAERERKEAERKQSAAEEAEFLASLQESGGPPPEITAEPAPAVAASSRSSVWGAAPAPSGNVWTASAKGMSAPAAAPAGAAPPATGSSLSPTTQRWLMTQGGPAQPAAAAPPQAAPAFAAPPVTNQDGLSPATRAWLAQQGVR
jgi:hypothetical protein